jgi:hypothetical protein
LSALARRTQYIDDMTNYIIQTKSGFKVSVPTEYEPQISTTADSPRLAFAGSGGKSLVAVFLLSEVAFWYEEGKASVVGPTPLPGFPIA